MSIVVTGATGHLGRLVVEDLLDRGVAPDTIVATGRNVAKVGDLADRGVRVTAVDHSDPDSLRPAFAGAEKVLLVSGSDPSVRMQQHLNVIEAAREAGVGLLAYTSIAHADRTQMALAADHQATEAALRESGVPHALLRNSWYLENYTAQLPVYVQTGAVLGSADGGRISAATRADYAAAAAAVLVAEDQAGAVYELGGDDAFTLDDLAQAVSEATGKPVVYRDLPVEGLIEILVGAGVPEPYAAVLADSDLGVARGDLYVDTGDLSRLIGRAPTSMPDAVRAAVEEAGLRA
jgi:NAD(P)H dehydrogenase (quinone)